jgi:hypothetical protein
VTYLLPRPPDWAARPRHGWMAASGRKLLTAIEVCNDEPFLGEGFRDWVAPTAG